MDRLSGKSILVAGGGFIGGELAFRYASEGAQILIGDLNLANAQKIADKITNAKGSALAVQLDGTDEASIEAAVATCCERIGRLDGLHVNFASFADGAPDSGVTDLPLAAYDETMEVNARGYVLCTRHALKALIASGGGSIVYTSSAAAYLSEADTLRLCDE